MLSTGYLKIFNNKVVKKKTLKTKNKRNRIKFKFRALHTVKLIFSLRKSNGVRNILPFRQFSDTKIGATALTCGISVKCYDQLFVCAGKFLYDRIWFILSFCLSPAFVYRYSYQTRSVYLMLVLLFLGSLFFLLRLHFICFKTFVLFSFCSQFALIFSVLRFCIYFKVCLLKLVFFYALQKLCICMFIYADL